MTDIFIHFPVFVLLFPGLMVIVFAFLTHNVFIKDQKTPVWKVAAGITALLAAFLSMAYYIVADDIGLFAFFMILPATCIALLTGFVLIIHNRNIILALIIGLLIPLLMFGTYFLAEGYSPSTTRLKYGDTLAKLLDQYKQDTGVYPPKLDMLMPKYTAEIKDSGTLWGWLYISTGQDFTLGYVSYVDRFGYSVDVISATNREWDVRTDSGPFKLGPTPTSTYTP
jgi:hypothetical protein